MKFTRTPLWSIATVNDEVLSDDTDADFEFTYVDIASISDNRISDSTYQVSFRESPSRARRVVQLGDIALSTVRTYLRAIAPVTEDYVNAVFSTGFAIIRPDQTICNPSFLRYALLSDEFIDEVVSHSNGVSYPSITAGEVMRIRIDFPTLEAQQRIADYLDRETAEIDAAVADLDRYVELLEKRRRVVIVNSVTGRLKESEADSMDRLSSPTFMDDQEMGGIDWLGKVNPSWGYAPLFTLGSPKKTPNTGMVENNLLSLSYGRIVRRDIESSEGLVPASYETYQIVEPGDLVLRFTDLQNDQRSLRSGLVRERGIITSAYLSFTPDEKKLSPLYFAYLMRAVDLSKVFYRMGSGVRQSLNWGELSLMRLPLPSLEVQHRIAGYLDQETSEIDTLISESTKLRDLLIKRRSVLITEVVTGRKQV